jgi:hypothetical protein
MNQKRSKTMRTDQVTANQGGNALRGIFNSLFRICLLVGVFAMGVWVGRQGPAFSPSTVRTEKQETLPGTMAADPTLPADAAMDPAALLDSLQSRVRALRAENNRLTSVMNENRIHYQLLRNHGYDEHSPECLELVRRQNSLVRQLDDISAAISTWLPLESQLMESIRNHGSTSEMPGMDLELLQTIERHLTRSGWNVAAPAPIPDELWVGGGDLRMGLPETTRSTEPSADKTRTGMTTDVTAPTL